jgi:hypothetical protein
VLPFCCYLGLVVAGAGFLTLKTAAFDVLAVVIISVLLLGIVGAWELMIWLALTRVRAKDLGE